MGICEECRYFAKDSVLLGECRFSPPVIAGAGDVEDYGPRYSGLGYGIWPRVSRDDWCSEWKGL